ncbi:hypothetical protein [Streptomyces sp. NPDC059994]|uniref:hypothetical protein n=1 Tax=Streptomyces sp. NPDC059994 TaxID=3347029 RepID=UPI0036807933
MALGLDDAFVTGMELLVSVCRALTDSESSLPWQDRLESVIESMGLQQVETGFAAIVSEVQTPEGAKNWLKAFQKANYLLFACRLLGAAEYRRYFNAAREDQAVVALAARRALRALMPFAVAWSDAVGSMSKGQLKAVSNKAVLSLDLVRGIAFADKALGEKLLSNLPMELTAATRQDLTGWEPDDLTEIVGSLRDRVAEASAERLQRENSQLVRKIRGARDALKYSEDGVSQAANSLIELIDRIMREAVPPKHVLEWIADNLPDEPGLTFINKDGNKAPTKRGEALCFIYSGGSVAREANEYDDGVGPALIQDVLARIFVGTRDQLQKLKHSDAGTQEEREQLLGLFTALEGALLLGLSIRRFPPLAEPAAPAA